MPSWLCCTHAPRSKPEEIYQMAQMEEHREPPASPQPPRVGRPIQPLVPTVEVTAPELPKTQFSWEKRERIDLTKVTVSNLVEETVSRTDFNGEPCIIEKCKDSIIVIKGYMSAVTIDDCVDTLIVLGPCSGSVFIRDCFNCSLLSVCGQLRTRDCHNLELVLRCTSEPIIEQSTDVILRPLCLFYPELKEHMKKAGLDIFRDQAVSIHDFTPNHMRANYKIEKKTISMTESGLATLAKFEIHVDPSRSLFPCQTAHGTSFCFAYQGVEGNSKEYQEDRERLMTELNASPKLAVLCAMDLEMPSWGGGPSSYDQLPLPIDSFGRISIVGCSGWRDDFETVIIRHEGYTLVPAEECENMVKRLVEAELLER